MPCPAKLLVLSVAEQAELTATARTGTHQSRTITRVRTLLLAAAGKSRVVIESEPGISTGQHWRTKQRYVAPGLAQAPQERPRSGQARPTRLAGSKAPAGTTRWPLSLLTDRAVNLPYADILSRESTCQVLKKANASPG